MGLIIAQRPRDVQRGRLYRAEREVAAVLRDPLPTISELQGYVDSLLRDRWMRDRFGSKVLAPITIIGERGRDASAMSFLSTISVPKTLRSKFIVIHEATHILADRYYGRDVIASHGKQFATILLSLVSHFLGFDDALALLDAFDRNGVEHSYRLGELKEPDRATSK